MGAWKRVWRAALAGVLLAGACTVPVMYTPAAPPPRREPPVTRAMERGVAGEVIVEGNRARRSAGLGELVSNDTLMLAAQAYAVELAQRGKLDHVSPTPGLETMIARIEAAGATWMAAAENLAQTHGEPAEVPPQVVRLWLDSPGHRVNLLGERYTHTGVGVAIDAAGRWFVVQLYVLPRRPAR